MSKFSKYSFKATYLFYIDAITQNIDKFSLGVALCLWHIYLNIHNH